MQGCHLWRVVVLLAFCPLLPADTLQYFPGYGIYNNVGDALSQTPNPNDPSDFFGGYAIRYPNGTSEQTMPPNVCEMDFCTRYTNGFNDRGEILNTDSSMVLGSLIELYSAGKWVTVANVPWESIGTGLNASGAALYVVEYVDSSINTVNNSYVFQNGKTSAVAYPGAKNSTYAEGINNEGEIVGTYSDAASHEYGFIEKNGQYTTVKAPGMLGTTILWFVNSAGEYVASSSSGWWLFNGSQYVSLNRPGTGTSKIIGLNDAGEVVGEYEDGSGNTQSFLFDNGTFTQIESGKTNVSVQGITNTGDVYGYFQNINGSDIEAGNFLGVPVASTPEPATAGAITIGLALLIGGAVRRRRRVL